MKLRNKKTGEVVLATNMAVGIGKSGKWYESLTELNEEWEDYEEPKKYWFIDASGRIVQNEIKQHRGDRYTDMLEIVNSQKEIGNYFETKEEAEKAVEKLKAWKRLRDNNFKFLNVKNVTPDVPIDKYYVHIEATFDAAGLDDLKLLFGGKACTK